MSRRQLLLTLTIPLVTAACADSSPADLPLESIQAAIVPTSGLLAHYPLDGDATDMGPSEFDGVVAGTESVMDRFGLAERAPELSGAASEVTLPGESTNALSSGTLNVWVRFNESINRDACGRPDGPAVSPFPCQYNIFAKRDPSDPGFRGQLGGYSGLGQPNDAFGFRVGGEAWLFTPPTSFDFEGWHMYTFVWSPSARELYFDANLVASGSGGVATPSTGDLALGRNTTDTFGFRERLNGAMDDLRIYNGALQVDEITQLFNENPDPHDAAACRDGGWQAFGFDNQGLCVRFVKTGKDSRE